MPAYILNRDGGKLLIRGGGALLLRESVPPTPVADAVTGGWGSDRPRKRRWHVELPDGTREYFDDARAAWARFAEVYDPQPEPEAPKRRGKRRISVPAVPARTVVYDGAADATRSFAKLLREEQAAAAVAALLREIEADAIRRAAEAEDEEEAAATLLLM
jgi:hypothetical protein